MLAAGKGQTNEAEKSGECAIGYIRRRGRRDIAFGDSYSVHIIRSRTHEGSRILPILTPYVDVLVQYKYSTFDILHQPF